MLVEQLRDGKPSAIGGASGIVAGLVAITPACAAVTPLGAIAIGVVAGILCALALRLKYLFGYDDALDVVAVHLVGGLVGCLLIGLLATSAAPAGVDGLFFGGGFELLGKQAIAAGAVLAYSFIVTLVLAKLVDLAIGLRAHESEELAGLDPTQHGEMAYDLTHADEEWLDLTGATVREGQGTVRERIPAP